MNKLSPAVSPKCQRGAVTLIAAVLLLMVVVLALNVGLIRMASDITDTSLLGDGVEALYLAESGVERAGRLLSAGGGAAACTAAGLEAGSSKTLGRGTFSVLSAPAPAMVATDCRLRVRGVIGNVARTLEANLRPGATPLFLDQFSGAAGWSQVLTNTGGTSGYDASATCPGSVCATSAGGSMRAQTNAAGGNERITGYQWRLLPATLSTGGGLSLTTTIGYVKHSDNGNPRAATIGVVIEDTGAGVQTTIWADPAPGSAPTCATPPTGCWQANTQVVALPAGRSYTRIRLVFDLHERGANRVAAWFDEISLTDGTGGISVVRWADI